MRLTCCCRALVLFTFFSFLRNFLFFDLLFVVGFFLNHEENDYHQNLYEDDVRHFPFAFIFVIYGLLIGFLRVALSFFFGFGILFFRSSFGNENVFEEIFYPFQSFRKSGKSKKCEKTK